MDKIFSRKKLPTTCKVAKEFHRNYIGIELNPSYIKMAEKRLAQGILL